MCVIPNFGSKPVAPDPEGSRFDDTHQIEWEQVNGNIPKKASVLMTRSLKEYRKKRDFQRTPEPEGKAGKTSGNRIFVIHKHDATRLHYDFRLEVDGVLVSWAVPKGPSTDPRETRLAIPTEDHPLEYADFEGVIPEGEYGGGTVLIWDRGSYRNLREKEGDDSLSMAESIEDGKVEVWLEGEKIQGGFALIRTGSGRNPGGFSRVRQGFCHKKTRLDPEEDGR
jgi:DNA ligase D-like protein (predicted 3'-phosphoesterase)